MEIGNKLKEARNRANLTQEQVAEALAVSRQSVSNWENNRFYPDIVSVIKMSDLYSVSLDTLLKVESPMSNYYQFLEESTNVVKSRQKLTKLLEILSFVVIWAVAVLVFWLFSAPEGAMGYAIIALYIVLPITTFVISILIGKDITWGKLRWLFFLFFGFMFMMMEYATFSTANMISFHKVNLPDITLLLVGGMISLSGLGIGKMIQRFSKNNKGI
jgi:transcriptional regulator with XRE-family HTH domain